jgi:hypothetical protein
MAPAKCSLPAVVDREVMRSASTRSWQSCWIIASEQRNYVQKKNTLGFGSVSLLPPRSVCPTVRCVLKGTWPLKGRLRAEPIHRVTTHRLPRSIESFCVVSPAPCGFCLTCSGRAWLTISWGLQRPIGSVGFAMWGRVCPMGRPIIRVLVVEDYEPWRRFISTTLQKQPELEISGQDRTDWKQFSKPKNCNQT